MMDMTPLRYCNGNQHLHRKSADYRSHVKRKMRAYHVFIQAGSFLGPAPVSRRRCSQARLGLVRVVAENHSSGHPAVRVCRCQRPAPDASGFSPGFRRKRF